MIAGMGLRRLAISWVLACAGAGLACQRSPADEDLAAFIGTIRAVDNHTHANTVDPADSEYDALPLEALLPFEIPARLRPENPDWIAAYRGLYDYPYSDLSDAHVTELRATMRRLAQEKGDQFPVWVLDKIGTEVMLANRVAMGPGLTPPRFRWVSYVDALMLPLSTKTEATESPDREKLYPYEEKLLHRFLAELHVDKLPATLDAYVKTVVTPTLEAQRGGGCLAVKFEAAFLRSLDFAEVSTETASAVYSRYVGGGEPKPEEYKALEDFLFRAIAREAGRLGMAVHMHTFHGPGNFYRAAGSDPLLLESAFNDPHLRDTKFVLVHGGGAFASHAGAMLWKPNVYLDISAMTLIDSPAKLAETLRHWLLEYPEKVLFGTDAATFGPEAGWDVTAWIATSTARQALAIALGDMLRKGEVTRARAQEIATMVMRTNAATLYQLQLP
jgi:hypothetical protein